MHHKWQSYDVWFLRYGAQQTEFFVILDHFLPFGPRKSKFVKNEKNTKDIIILQLCTINDSHMMYGCWNMECNGQMFLSFWTVFCPFTPLTTWKSKFSKYKKTAWRYYHFTQFYHKWQSYDVWFLRYRVQQTEFFIILDKFLPFYPLTT